MQRSLTNPSPFFPLLICALGMAAGALLPAHEVVIWEPAVGLVQHIQSAPVPNGGVGGRPVAPVPCDRSSATNFQTNLHEDASA